MEIKISDELNTIIGYAERRLSGPEVTESALTTFSWASSGMRTMTPAGH